MKTLVMTDAVLDGAATERTVPSHIILASGTVSGSNTQRLPHIYAPHPQNSL